MIADDDPFARDGIVRLLRRNPRFEVVSDSPNASELIEPLRRSSPDVVLLDLHMPGPDPVTTIRSLSAAAPAVRIIVLTVDGDEVRALRMLRAGASGYVQKRDAHRELGDAIERVADGYGYVSSHVVSRVARESLEERGLALSNREREVAWRLVDGERVSDIARELRLSPKTVSTYRGRVLQKTGARSNAELIRAALEGRLDGA